MGKTAVAAQVSWILRILTVEQVERAISLKKTGGRASGYSLSLRLIFALELTA